MTQADRSLEGLSGPVVLVGAGRMGGALLQGWLERGLAASALRIFEPQPSPEIRALNDRGTRINPPVAEVRDAAAVVIAVKPQVAGEIVPGLAPMLGPTSVAISIMAGKTLGFLQGHLPDSSLVRAMPNTPAAIGRGITVAVANARTGADQRRLAHALLASVGEVAWVDDEGLMDAVTAISGSGPAYVFLLAETLARAGVTAGLPADLAAKLARATVAGSGELLHRSPLTPAELRQNVTSPGGTTAAALEVLMAADGLEPLLRRAVLAATKRSRELAV